MGPWGRRLRKVVVVVVVGGRVLLTAYFLSRLAFHAFEGDSIGKLKTNVHDFLSV
jgi:hypothetical protein